MRNVGDDVDDSSIEFDANLISPISHFTTLCHFLG